MRFLPTLLAILAVAWIPTNARAQAFVDFDSAPEGFVGATYATPAGTFQDLVLSTGMPGEFAIEDASGATFSIGETTRSLPNMLGVGGFTAGPGFGVPAVTSFRIVLPQSVNSIRFELYVNTFGLSTTMVAEFYDAGQLVTGYSTATPNSFVHRSIWTCGMSGFTSADEIRFRVFGPGPNPRFFACAFDDFRIANAPCIPSTQFCTGVGTGACPCGNTPPAGSNGGCLDSLGVSPELSGYGTASIGADDFVANALNLPHGTSGLLVGSATAVAPVAFGDGVLCLGSPVMRLGAGTALGGALGFPPVGGPGIAARSGITSPGTQRLQLWYRNSSSFCTPAAYNLTNGIEVIWYP